MEKPIECDLTNMCLCSVCTLHVYDLLLMTEILLFQYRSELNKLQNYKPHTYLKSKTPKRKE